MDPRKLAMNYREAANSVIKNTKSYKSIMDEVVKAANLGSLVCVVDHAVTDREREVLQDDGFTTQSGTHTTKICW